MKKITVKMLKLIVKASEKFAVKSCSLTSGYDLYQPKIPDAVRDLAKKSAK